MPRGMLAPKKEVIAGRRKLHNEELHNFCSSPDIIRGTKLNRKTWAGHTVRMETI
jgi:hypothetical protein